MRRWAASIGLCVALCAPIATAAQTATAGSGAIVVEDALAPLRTWAAQARSGEIAHVPTLKDDSPEVSIASERAKLFGRMTAYRSECRAELRKANRDARFAVTLRCFRGLLSLQLTTLQRWERFADDMPGVPPAIAEAERSAVRSWADAITTVIGAIDAGVYEAESGLADVRRRLVLQYAVGAEYARLRTRRAYDAGWLLVTSNQLEALRAEGGTLDPNIAEIAEESAACIESILPPPELSPPSLPGELLPLAAALAEYERGAPECLTKIKNIARSLIQEQQNSSR